MNHVFAQFCYGELPMAITISSYSQLSLANKTRVADDVVGWGIYMDTIWVNYDDLTATSLGIMVHKGSHPLLWP